MNSRERRQGRERVSGGEEDRTGRMRKATEIGRQSEKAERIDSKGERQGERGGAGVLSSTKECLEALPALHWDCAGHRQGGFQRRHFSKAD